MTVLEPQRVRVAFDRLRRSGAGTDMLARTPHNDREMGPLPSQGTRSGSIAALVARPVRGASRSLGDDRLWRKSGCCAAHLKWATIHMMRRAIAFLSLLALACAPVIQPESGRIVAAYEVTLRTPDDYRRFLSILDEVGKQRGFHLDHRDGGGVEPFTINASVWRGDDDEAMAHAMDFQDRIGRVWVTFPLGEDPSQTADFRSALMARIRAAWPSTVSLPIMPNGAIPLTDDLVRTLDGYRVLESAASKYQNQEM